MLRKNIEFILPAFKIGSLISLVVLGLIGTGCNAEQKKEASETAFHTPNIVIIYIDDLGYGDVGAYGATRVATPNVDKLAANGLLFTDAHCSAATCTPSRFTLLTGMYAFRNNAAILPGDAPLLIEPGSATLPAILKTAGYRTAVVGKWHLGLGRGSIAWNDSIAPGPLETGFDYSFLIPATTDRVPCVYVENHRVYNLDPSDPIEVSYRQQIGEEPTGLNHPEMLKMAADTQHSNTIINGISRIGYMKGGTTARWVDEDIADVLTEKAKQFIGSNKSQPFFLYFSVPDIHVPRAPNKRFVGSTEMGRRGDVITEMDWMTGEIMHTLDSLGIANNTLIIFSSDNGPVLDDGYHDQAVELLGDHKPWGPYSGGKYSAFEAGTRVPMIVSWPGVVEPGTTDLLFTQTDLLASLAALTGQELKDGAASDSEDHLDLLLGRKGTERAYMLEEAYTLALRKGKWKFIAPQEKATPGWMKNKDIASGLSPDPQLYNLETDPAEKNNVAEAYPQLIKEFNEKLAEIRRVKRTRPGFQTASIE